MISVITSLVAPVANYFTSRNEIKAKADVAKAAVAKAKADGETQHTLNIDEWEALSKQAEGGTWKDEYITIVITSPFVLLFVASMVSAFTGDVRYIDSVSAGIASLQSLGIDLGYLMGVVVLAAVGIKGVKSLR